MKKINYYFVAIILTILFSSCKTQKNLRERLIIVEDYKKVYFKNCLGYGFNNSKKVNEILDEDFSLNSDFIQGKRNYLILDSLAKVTNKEIKKDSIQFYNDWKVRGKRVLTKCLNGYTSKWLDSMAKTTYNLKVKKYKHYSKYK